MRTGSCLRALLLGLACLAGSTLADGREDYEQGRQHWRQGEYREAYTRLWRYRTQPYGRTAQVDYMLGTSACRLDDLRTWGGNVLAWVLHRYPLSTTSHDIVAHELQQCRAAQTMAALDGGASADLDGLIGASARASGKTFYWVGKGEVINAYPAQRLRDIPRLELSARLVPLGRPQQVQDTVQRRVPDFNVVVFDRFVLASRSGRTPEVMRSMAGHLDRYLGFLDHEYAIGLPDSYVTVYLVPTPEALGQLAERLHGLKISRATFGYAFRDDLSVLAAVADGFAIGTIMHEFFHVAVRSRFGDIPQWLDEGMASLYEVARFDGDRVSGLPNWRGAVLARLESRRPPLRQLLTSSWFAFEQPGMARQFPRDAEEGPSAEVMAATLASARYFTLYLQEKGQLKDIYEDFRKQEPTGLTQEDPGVEAVAVIERHLGKDIDSIDADFMRWFRSVNQQTPSR